MAVALVTGLLFGVVPALVTTKQPNETLRDGGRHGGSRRLHQVLRTLVVSEVAISLVLLAGAGLLLRSFIKLQNVDPGFRAGGVLTAAVDLPTTSYDLAHAEVAFHEALTRIAALPGVVSTSGASCQPVPYACMSSRTAGARRRSDSHSRIEQLRLDLPVVVFSMAVALVTGLLFGIVPAFVTTKHSSELLREGGRHGGGRRLHHVLRTLVVAEVAIPLVLLAGAGLLLRSFIKLQA